MSSNSVDAWARASQHNPLGPQGRFNCTNENVGGDPVTIVHDHHDRNILLTQAAIEHGERLKARGPREHESMGGDSPSSSNSRNRFPDQPRCHQLVRYIVASEIDDYAR